jgi:protocatechuate 3,4-dioxygenase beta subunit
MRRGLPILLMLSGVGAFAFLLLRTLSVPAPGPAEGPVAPGTEAGGASSVPGPPPAAVAGGGSEDAPPPGGSGAVFGLVREATTGAPVAGSAVVLTGALGGGRKSADTLAGEDGGYRFEGLPPGKFQVQARPARHADSAVVTAVVEEGAEARVDLEVVPGAAVSGLVTEKGSGAALSGVTVTANLHHRRNAKTGPDGRYRLEGLPAGALYLTAEGPDHPAVGGTTTVSGPGAEATLNFELARGAVVSGSVTDSQGAPVPEAEVMAVGAPARQVKTGADGAFTLRGVPVERQVIVTASKAGFATTLSDALILRPAEEMEGLRLVLLAGARVRGRVLTAEGLPAADAQVMVIAKPAPGMRPAYPPNGKADAAGAFDLFPVPPGEWQVAARLMGAQFVQQDIGAVAEGEVVEGVVIRLAGGERIEGTVTDGAGKPMGGLHLNASPAAPGAGGGYSTARTDDAGRFRLQGLPPGNYIVSVHSARGLQLLTVEAPAGTLDLKIVVPSPGSISGRVLLPDGEPVKTFFIRVEPDDPQRGGVLMQERVTDERGNFRLSGINPGLYVVTAIATEGFSERERGVAVAAGEETPGLNLVLRPGGTIRGRVVTAEGSPIAGARVMAMAVRAAPLAPTGPQMQTTGPDGEFVLADIAPGAWRVSVFLGSSFRNSDEVELLSGGEARVEVRFPRTGTVVVRVSDDEGRPVAGAWVAVADEQGRSAGMVEVRIPPDVPPDRRAAAEREARERSYRTDAGGRCEREGVPEGDLRITVSAPGFAPGEAKAHLSETGRVEVDVTLHAPAPGEDERKPQDKPGG